MNEGPHEHSTNKRHATLMRELFFRRRTHWTLDSCTK